MSHVRTHDFMVFQMQLYVEFGPIVKAIDGLGKHKKSTWQIYYKSVVAAANDKKNFMRTRKTL